jgi:hypothetical protein
MSEEKSLEINFYEKKKYIQNRKTKLFASQEQMIFFPLHFSLKILFALSVCEKTNILNDKTKKTIINKAPQW